MNANTQNAITAVLGLINPALGIIGQFVTGAVTGAAGAKITAITGQVQDAVKVVTALTPLITQFGDGQEVTPDRVRASLAGMDDALAEAGKLIAEREAEESVKK